MRGLLAAAIFALCAAPGAQAQDAQPVQVFACRLNPGKSIANVMALAEAFRSAWPSMKIADKGGGAFLWTSFREGTPYDYVVGFINTSLKDAAASLQRYYDSGLGAGLDAQFGETGECDSSIVFSEQLRNGALGQTADDQPDALVESFACKLREGSGMADVDAATEFWRQQVAALNSKALNQYEAYLWTPYRGGSGQADFLWIGHYPDLATWAQGETDYLASEQGRAAEERFGKVSSCTNALWVGYWIVPPTVGPTAR